MYAAATGCPWPIYSTYPSPSSSSSTTSPSSPNSTKTANKKQEQAGEKIYSTLGMIRTLRLGKKRPRYMRVTGLLTNSLQSIWVGLRVGALQVVRGEGGDFSRVGGEFLFECRPAEDEEGKRQEKVVWCHRMKTTRDHTEAEDIQRVLSVKSWA